MSFFSPLSLSVCFQHVRLLAMKILIFIPHLFPRLLVKKYTVEGKGCMRAEKSTSTWNC